HALRVPGSASNPHAPFIVLLLPGESDRLRPDNSLRTRAAPAARAVSLWLHMSRADQPKPPSGFTVSFSAEHTWSTRRILAATSSDVSWLNPFTSMMPAPSSRPSP